MRHNLVRYVQSNSTFCTSIKYPANFNESTNARDAKSMSVSNVETKNKRYLMKMINGQDNHIGSVSNVGRSSTPCLKW